MTTMDPSRPGDRTLLAFVRGEQQVEIAARDRGRGTFNLYLLTFEQRCNALPAGCLPGDLFTPAIESAWTHVELRDDEDLKNTPLDCRQCHQRGRQSPILLMRELQFPWTHFFEAPADTAFREPNGGMALERAYERAKGDEAYANFSSSAIAASSAEGLEGVVTAEQPLVFDSQTILDERLPSSAPAGSPPERSPTWDREYETFKLGEHLALPYFDADPTDPDKLGALTTAYRSYLAGSMPAADLPDLADVFPDDPHVRAQIGLQTEPDATPAEVLVQACCPCHDDVLDQSISRARFNVALSRLDADELTVAVDRLRRSREEAGAMPAPAARQLDSAARTRLIEYLESGAFSNADLDMLAHAAQAGMSGNAQ